MKRPMSKVILFYDGTYKIEDIGEKDHNTLSMFCSMNVNGIWKDCKVYYCAKGREQHYLRKLAESIIADKEKQIRKLTEEKYKLIDAFEDLLKDQK